MPGAYAVSYSVGPCEFLYWALSEPPFGTAWGSRFFILTDRDMARIQVAMAVTIDGFLPYKDHTLAEWVRTSSNGFPRWRDACSYPLFPKYPLLDLICDKGHSDDTFTYYAEIMTRKVRNFAGDFSFTIWWTTHPLSVAAHNKPGDTCNAACIPRSLETPWNPALQ